MLGQKIVIDSAIPFIKGVFEPYGFDVRYLAGLAIKPEDVLDASVLITRTRTRCDKALLEGSSVGLVATATIGLDHIDLKWCSEHGIRVESAPGCNAGGVASYVLNALAFAGLLRSDVTVGIVGVGHVGSRVESLLRAIGLKVLRYDPPRALREGRECLSEPKMPDDFCTLDTLCRRSDVVTFHLPLDSSTRGFGCSAFFEKLSRCCLFINSSRGECVCDNDLLSALDAGLVGSCVIDTFAGEPGEICSSLTQRCLIATPHIAGYSLRGKINATEAVVRHVAAYLNLPALIDFSVPDMPGQYFEIDPLRPGVEGEIVKNQGIIEVSHEFCSDLRKFEYIRQNYSYRPEIIVTT